MNYRKVENVCLHLKKKKPWPVWLSWLECCPINQKAAGSVSTQGTCLGCRFGPWSVPGRGNIYGDICLSIYLSIYHLHLKEKDLRNGLLSLTL